MQDQASFLAALQLADSAFPIGRFVHSYGLEAWISRNGWAEDDFIELLESTLLEAVAPLDGAAVAHAHQARSIGDLLDLDRRLTARKLTPSARLASRSCGRQLAALALVVIDEPLTSEFCGLVKCDRTNGNLAVTEGAVARALGIGAGEAVLLELRATANAFLSAAIRLGRLPPLRAQVLLRALAPVIVQGANEALAIPRSALRTTGPELEIYALVHKRAEGRIFTT
jgi:urease accessory protein